MHYSFASLVATSRERPVPTPGAAPVSRAAAVFVRKLVLHRHTFAFGGSQTEVGVTVGVVAPSISVLRLLAVTCGERILRCVIHAPVDTMVHEVGALGVVPM